MRLVRPTGGSLLNKCVALYDARFRVPHPEASVIQCNTLSLEGYRRLPLPNHQSLMMQRGQQRTVADPLVYLRGVYDLCIQHVCQARG